MQLKGHVQLKKKVETLSKEICDKIRIVFFYYYLLA